MLPPTPGLSATSTLACVLTVKAALTTGVTVNALTGVGIVGKVFRV